MITLTILNADGTIYWTEHFNSVNQAVCWVNEEKTRAYWKSDFTYRIEDNTPVTTQDQIIAQAWNALRSKRNLLLSECDWTQLSDCPFSADVKQSWASYRTALRTLPDQPGLDPTQVSWPIPPS